MVRDIRRSTDAMLDELGRLYRDRDQAQSFLTKFLLEHPAHLDDINLTSARLALVGRTANMALIPDNVRTRESEQEIRDRFGIAQDGKPTEAQLREQLALKHHIADIAVLINADIEDSREKSLALTHLEEALMWAGKAIFR